MLYVVLSDIFEISWYIFCILLGTSFLQGTTIGLELVDDIRQQIQVLMEYATIICKSSDIEFVQVQTELREMSKTLSQNDYRMSVLENVSNNS